jgi:methionyl-tRNA formyltransferase
MKIIFMGTPDFSTAALKSLINSDHEVVAVFTAPPKPKGRGMSEICSPVHAIANMHNIPVYTPKTLRNAEIQDKISAIDADIIIVIAYGFIIPQAILDMKKYGCLNIHPSKLPRFRGAAPLQRTIIAGDSETAVCIMQMDAGIDTGDILLQQDLVLPDRVSLSELHDVTAVIGADLLLKVLDNIDHIIPVKQLEEGVVYANKLSKEESLIDWSESAYMIDCKVRGMNPWPGVYFNYLGEQIKVLEATAIEYTHNLPFGTVIDDALLIACGEGALRIEKLQRPNKKILPATEFLLGFPIEIGSILVL